MLSLPLSNILALLRMENWDSLPLMRSGHGPIANFVQSIDGIASFKGPHAAGSDISQSPEDRWLMDLLRAHADAIITGIHTLVEETLSAPKLNEGRGPVYRIEDESLRDLRTKLGRKREKVIFVTASGSVDPRAYRVFDGDQMDATDTYHEAGAARLQGRIAQERLIIAGEDKTIDLPAAMRMLRKEDEHRASALRRRPNTVWKHSASRTDRREVCDGVTHRDRFAGAAGTGHLRLREQAPNSMYVQQRLCFPVSPRKPLHGGAG